jgi:hypothetical protein
VALPEEEEVATHQEEEEAHQVEEVPQEEANQQVGPHNKQHPNLGQMEHSKGRPQSLSKERGAPQKSSSNNFRSIGMPIDATKLWQTPSNEPT